MNPRPVPTVSDIGLGDHATFIYQNESEHRAVMTRFLRYGLERGEEVLYVADAHPPEVVLNYLRGDRVDVDAYISRGQLRVLSPRETYLRDGAFEPEKMIGLINYEVEQALVHGYAGLRGTGEMTWALEGLPGSERLLQYEVMINELAESGRCVFVCQYDRNRFEPEFLLDILHTHPTVIVGTEVCENFYYIEPVDLTYHYLPAARFRACLENLLARKRMEETLFKSMEQLRHSHKLESIGKLAGGVAHDFRNLITAIGQYAELLQMDLPASDPRRKDTEKILSSAQRANQLVSQLLAFARRQELKPRELNLNTVVEDLESMLKRLAGNKVDVITLLDPELLPVRADEGQLEQVVMNMVVNAQEAMPDGGRITIRTDNIFLQPSQSAKLPEARPGQFVRLSVIDSGLGMDGDVLEQMFEPFFTTKEDGTGLGLSVAYGIVKQHGGWINVESEPARGTRFRIYFPAVRRLQERKTERYVSRAGATRGDA